MNQKISFTQLTELIASRNECSINVAEVFVKSLFNTISDALSNNKSVTINGLGVFRKSEDENEILIFQPDKTFIDTVNTPFSCFEPIELEDNITEELFANEIDSFDSPISTNDNIKNELPENIEIIDKLNDEESEIIEISNVISNEEETQIESIELTDCTETINNTTTDININQEEQQQTAPIANYNSSQTNVSNKKLGLFSIIFLTIGILIGAILGFAIKIYFDNTDLTKLLDRQNAIIDSININNNVINENIIIKDSIIESCSTNTSLITNLDSVEINKTDTITKTCFLTTMARKHFGNLHFWVYIYEENKSRLGHPDKIKPGTIIKIPTLSKYNINVNDSGAINNAKIKASEIYARYK